MDREQQILGAIFQTTQQIDRGEITLKAGRDELVRIYGLNENSAHMTIRSLRHLFNGERYRRALTLDATDYFLRRICAENGIGALKKALEGLSAHIEYRHATGVSVPGLQGILARHTS